MCAGVQDRSGCVRPCEASLSGLASNPYDRIAHVYDEWTADFSADVDFYVAQASELTGPVVELGVGTGRIAIPMAAGGASIIGVDASAGMLEECRRRAEAAGVAERIQLRLGDFRAPPVDGPVTLVTCPYRALLHLQSHTDRQRALAAVHELLEPGGRFVFDVFTAPPGHRGVRIADWDQRSSGVWERDQWDAENRTMTVSLRSESDEADLELAWLPREEWRTLLEAAGFEIYACYGWFDLAPCARDGLAIWVARRPL